MYYSINIEVEVEGDVAIGEKRNESLRMAADKRDALVNSISGWPLVVTRFHRRRNGNIQSVPRKTTHKGVLSTTSETTLRRRILGALRPEKMRDDICLSAIWSPSLSD